MDFENRNPDNMAQENQANEPRTPYQTPVRTGEPQAHASEPETVQESASHTTFEEWSAQQKKHQNKSGKRVLHVVAGVLAAVVLFAGGAFAGTLLGNTGGSEDAASSAANAGESVQSIFNISEKPAYDADNYDTVNGLAGEEIYKKVSPSVVSVTASSLASGSVAYGSGVILSEDGYIITNHHVVSGSNKVVVTLSDGTELPTSVIGSDEQSDVAVLKATANNKLPAAEFGNSDELEPGEYAYAIGTPTIYRLSNTITGGRISAINRDITIDDRVMTLIQTDAAINSGNSGGALVNKFGQVVGITNAKLSGSYGDNASMEGLGFAIPIKTAKTIVDELMLHGYVAGRPAIGITGYNLAEDIAKYNDVPQGVVVTGINKNAKASDGGLQVNDIIIGVNGNTITTMDEINEVKKAMKAGDGLELTVYRMSTKQTLRVSITLTDEHELDSGEENTTQTQPANNYRNDGNNYYTNPFGYFFGN